MYYTQQGLINNFDRFNLFCWAEVSIEKIRNLLIIDNIDSDLKVNNAKRLCDRELAAIATLKERFKDTTDGCI